MLMEENTRSWKESCEANSGMYQESFPLVLAVNIPYLKLTAVPKVQIISVRSSKTRAWVETHHNVHLALFLRYAWHYQRVSKRRINSDHYMIPRISALIALLNIHQALNMSLFRRIHAAWLICGGGSEPEVPVGTLFPPVCPLSFTEECIFPSMLWFPLTVELPSICGFRSTLGLFSTFGLLGFSPSAWLSVGTGAGVVIKSLDVSGGTILVVGSQLRWIIN